MNGLTRARLGAGRRRAEIAIDRPGDRHEAEADRMARWVATESGTGATLVGGGGASLDREGQPAGGAGRPLDPTVRAHLEPRFGHDFSQVRIHTDARADAAAAAVGAVAFTAGRDIVFRSGEYAPETREGSHLLAHELTHVVQQATVPGAPAIQRQTPEPEPPRVPDLPGLTRALSDDIGENLFTYGHHFYRLASLYPDQPDLLEQAFGRYALGANVLETAFTFIGAEPGTAEVLALGTGITFKGVNFVTSGELVIDYQFDLGRGLKLETAIDLNVNPDDFTEVRGVDAGLSLIGEF